MQRNAFVIANILGDVGATLVSLQFRVPTTVSAADIDRTLRMVDVLIDKHLKEAGGPTGGPTNATETELWRECKRELNVLKSAMTFPREQRQHRRL